MKARLMCLAGAVVVTAAAWPSVVRAQALDTVTLRLDTRYLWRGYDRGDGLPLLGSASFALAGFSTSRAAGERQNFTADALTWIPVTNRDTRKAGDQYEGSLTYGLCLAQCDQNEWGKRTVVELSGNFFALPSVPVGATSTYEGQVALRHLLEIPKIGDRQVGIVLYPYLTAAHDFHRVNATYVRGGIGTSIGPASKLTFSLSAAAAVSDWPAATGASRGFGYHGADIQFGVDRDMRLGAKHLSTLVAWNLELPSESIGVRAGMLTVRWKLSGPVWMF